MLDINSCYCGISDADILIKTNTYSIVICKACSQVRTKFTSRIKRVQEYAEADIRVYLEKEASFRKIFQDLLKFLKNFIIEGAFLEIGAGVGLLVDEANKTGYSALGYEPSIAAVRAASKYFKVKLTCGTFNSGHTPTEDVIVLNHVLEHMPEPDKVINLAYQKLRKHGYLVIGVPNIGSLIARMKKDRWQSLIPSQHRWHFSLLTLDNLVCSAGFTRVAVKSYNHDRSMHPVWKRPIYAFLDTISTITRNGEALLVIYQRNYE